MKIFNDDLPDPKLLSKHEDYVTLLLKNGNKIVIKDLIDRIEIRMLRKAGSDQLTIHPIVGNQIQIS